MTRSPMPQRKVAMKSYGFARAERIEDREVDEDRDQGRLWDAHLPCICCSRTSEKQYLTGTNWDCGHYRSTGSAPHLCFHEDNAHRQLTVCNRHGAGRAVDYRIGLIARIGLARVEALEADNEPRHYTVDQLIAHYKQELKELKRPPPDGRSITTETEK